MSSRKSQLWTRYFGLIAAVLVIGIMIVCIIVGITRDPRRYATSSVDGQEYLVNPDKPARSADTLARVSRRVRHLMQHMLHSFPADKAVRRLRRFDPSDVVEIASKDKRAAYMMNKGEQMSLCLYPNNRGGKINEEPYDHNILMYVSMHELAHVMTETNGHDDMFYKNFALLLREAMSIGLYVKHDFMKNPVDYCGVTIQEEIGD